MLNSLKCPIYHPRLHSTPPNTPDVMKAPRGIKHKFGHSWASLTKPIFTSQLLHFFDDYLYLKKKKKKRNAAITSGHIADRALKFEWLRIIQK